MEETSFANGFTAPYRSEDVVLDPTVRGGETTTEEDEQGWLSTSTSPDMDLCGGDTTASAETVLETVDSCVNCMNGIDATTSIASAAKDPSFVVPLQDTSDGPSFLPFDPVLLTQMDLLLCGGSTTEQSFSSSTTSVETTTNPEKDLSAATNANVCELCDQSHKNADDHVLSSFQLPCCPNRSICPTCFRMISYPLHERMDWNDPDHRVGRCPFCKIWIQMEQDDGTQKLVLTRQSSSSSTPSCCGICNQIKETCWLRTRRIGEISEQQHTTTVVCDACFLGQVQPLWYECRTCGIRQSIPHPMYRYQTSPNSFGNQTWTCSNCGKFTYWRIVAHQCRFIPVGDAPWTREDALTEARARIQEIQKAVIQQQLQVLEAKKQEETCVII